MVGDLNGTPEERAQAMAQLLYNAGFRGEEIPLFVAIGMAESSGNPNAHNPNRSTGDDSYGLWQINMIDDFAEERFEWFDISSKEALYDPQTNADAAFEMLKRQGVNAWTTFKNGKHEPFMNLASTATQRFSEEGPSDLGTASFNTSGSAGSPEAQGRTADLNADGVIDRDEMLQEYPQYAWALDHPDIGPLLQEAAEGGYSQELLLAKLRETDWWKNTAATTRENEILRETDPAEWDRRRRQQLSTVEAIADQMGLEYNPTILAELGLQAMQMGWSTTEIRAALEAQIGQSNEFAAGNDELFTDIRGEVADNYKRLEGISQEYMIGLSDLEYNKWIRRIMTGETSVEAFENYAQRITRATMPWVTQFLDEGLTPLQAVAPYKSQVADVLEMNADEIDFNDAKYQNVLVDENGNIRSTSQLRKATRESFRDQWVKTSGAKQSAATLTGQIAKMFGKR